MDVGSILTPKWSQNQPEINKNLPFFVTVFAMRFFFVFLIFLLNFRGLRTSIIVLPCTREHDPREIAVFVFGPPCRWILANFHLMFDPQTLNMASGTLSRKNRLLVSIFLIFGSISGPIWPPWGGNFWQKSTAYIDGTHFLALRDAPGLIFSFFCRFFLTDLGVDFGGSGVDFGASGVDFGGPRVIFP